LAIVIRLVSQFVASLHHRVSLSAGMIVAFLAVDLLLVGAFLLALRQNVMLRGEVTEDVGLLTPAKGTVVPSLDGYDWTGVAKTIAYGQDRRPTLIYTFSKECSYCQQNWRAMRSLQALAPHRLRLVYVDTLGDLFTSKYLAASGIWQSVLLVQLSKTALPAYDARLVPQCLLVDRNGRVQWSHVGKLAAADITMAMSLIKQD
jgi:hypothetical protein